MYALAAGLIGGLISFFSTSGVSESAFARVDAVVQSYKDRGLLSGTLVVGKNGRTKSWDTGLADDRTGAVNGPRTVFLIASLSKSFVAASVLKLVQEGKLDLDDTLAVRLPEYTRGKAITIRNLLKHVSGVPEAYSTPEIERRIDREPLAFSDMLDAVKSRPLRFKPGARFEYSNTGYVLLGEIVHRVSGETYGGFVRRNFFIPLRLDHSSVGLPAAPGVEVARCYDRADGGRVDIQTEYGLGGLASSDVFADTNVYSSAADIAAWTEAVTSGRALPQALTDEMLTPSASAYGFGWIIFTDEHARAVYEHAGSYRGFQTWMRRYPKEDTTISWLGNEPMSDNDVFAFIEEVSEASLASFSAPSTFR